MHKCKSRTVGKTDRKKLIILKCVVREEFYEYPGPSERWTSGVLEQIKPETCLQAKMTKLKLSCFEHIMRRHGSLQKTILLEKWKAARKKEDQIWAGPTPWKKLQAGVHRSCAGLWKTAPCGRHSFTGSAGVGANPIACNTHEENACYAKVCLFLTETKCSKACVCVGNSLALFKKLSGECHEVMLMRQAESRLWRPYKFLGDGLGFILNVGRSDWRVLRRITHSESHFKKITLAVTTFEFMSKVITCVGQPETIPV